MKVLLVNGSPHKDGCTYTALKEVADTLEKCGIKTEIFWIGNHNFGGCIACKSCVKTGRCVYNDSVNECRKKATEADGFIFGTPVHYAAASGSMTAFMDRLFYSEMNGNGNKGVLLKACGGGRFRPSRGNDGGVRPDEQIFYNTGNADSIFPLLEYGSRH